MFISPVVAKKTGYHQEYLATIDIKIALS